MPTIIIIIIIIRFITQRMQPHTSQTTYKMH